jgi:hypothetical protein
VDLGIVTAASEQFWPLLRVTAPNKLEYALRHGYGLEVAKHRSDLRADRGELMLRTLERHEWCWFMGADTLITNMTIDATEICNDNTDVAMCQVWNRLNNDSMFLRSCHAVVKWIEETYCRKEYNAAVLARTDEIVQNDMDLQWTCGIRVTRYCQRAFNSWLAKTKDGLIKHVPTAMPGYGPWQRGDFVLHIPTASLDERIELMRKYLRRVVR